MPVQFQIGGGGRVLYCRRDLNQPSMTSVGARTGTQVPEDAARKPWWH
jgi:hypothetical protein